MFDFLRTLVGLNGERSPAEPVRFEYQILIKSRPEELYPLVDWSDERHLWRQLGHEVRADGQNFTLLVEELPGTKFESRVTAAEKPSFYAYDSVIIPTVGRLIGSHEEYRFLRVSDSECAVTLTVDARFVAGLGPAQWRFEQHKMRLSCSNALGKLKLMAEEGLEAVHAASRRLVV